MHAESDMPAVELDLVKGAPAIARYLGIAERTVYTVADSYQRTGDGMPIVRVPGLGLVTSRSAVRRYWAEKLGAVEETPVRADVRSNSVAADDPAPT
ncbi:MAG: hypothetical protein RLY86_110 [Pseudomonadota bacterium]|jgi:hypothetical protein